MLVHRTCMSRPHHTYRNLIFARTVARTQVLVIEQLEPRAILDFVVATRMRKKQMLRSVAATRYNLNRPARRKEKTYPKVIWSLYTIFHFCRRIFSGRVPVCAAINFFKSPTVSSASHLTRTRRPVRFVMEGFGQVSNLYILVQYLKCKSLCFHLPSRSLTTTSIMIVKSW